MTTATTPLKVAIENSRDYMKSNKRYSAVCVLLAHIDSLDEEALNKTLALYEVCGQLEAIKADGIYGPSSDLLKEEQFKPCKTLKNFEVAHFLRHVDFCSDEGRAEAVDLIRDRYELITTLYTYPAAKTDQDGVMTHFDYAEWVMDIGRLYFDEAVSTTSAALRIKSMIHAYAACVCVLDALVHECGYEAKEAQVMKANARHALSIWVGC